MDAHDYICFCISKLNILFSFWSTGFFSSPVWFRIFGVDWSGPVSGSDNIGWKYAWDKINGAIVLFIDRAYVPNRVHLKILMKKSMISYC
jgi:hypothetical protein